MRFFLFAAVPMVTGQANVVEYIANNIQPKFSVVTNWPSDNSELQLFEVYLPMKCWVFFGQVARTYSVIIQ